MRTQGISAGLPLRRGGGRSLAAHMAIQVDGRLQGKTLVANGSVFSAQDHVTPAYTRNTAFWGPAPLGVSPWNSDNGAINAGTLITPRHCIYTNHGLVGVGFPANGSTVRFVAADNTVVDRTQSQHFSIPGTDIVVALLSSDLPATIPPVKVAPDNVALWLGDTFNAPLLTLDQEEKGLVYDLYSVPSGSVFMRAPRGALRRSFNEVLIAGDSGNSFHGLLNDEWAVFGLVTNTEGQSPGMAGNNTALNSAIASVDALGGLDPGTGYTVTNPVLTAFKQV